MAIPNTASQLVRWPLCASRSSVSCTSSASPSDHREAWRRIGPAAQLPEVDPITGQACLYGQKAISQHHSAVRRCTKRDVFLAEMAAAVPWSVLEAVIAPHYPKEAR